MRIPMPLAACLGLSLAFPLVSLAQAAPFRYDPTWPAGSVPSDFRAQEVMGVDTDAHGRVFMSHATAHPVLVFDQAGTYLYSFGENIIREPHAVRVDPQGFVWTVDKELHQVHKFTPDGQLVGVFGTRLRKGRDATRLNAPTDIAFGRNGDAFVSDGYGNARVVRLSSDLRYKGEWGVRGVGPGQFHLPHSIATDPDGNVYVADRENKRIQVFTPDGVFLRQWSLAYKPFGLDITLDRRLYVVSELPDSVAVLTLDGQQLAFFTNPPPPPSPVTGRPRKPKKKTLTRNPGELAQPHMIAVDNQGAIYTAELRGHRVQKFLPQ